MSSSTVDSRPRDPGTARRRPAPPPTRRLVWGVSIVAVVLLGLVGAGILAVLRSAGDIPVVSDVRAELDGSTVVFSWDDPGLVEGDAYIVTVDGDPSPPQREESFPVAVEEGDRVCATVTVARDGKSGAPSAERCSDVGGGAP